MPEDFYSTFATVSLTVTGLWMIVAQARFSEWIADRDHFRRASAVSVQLAFPGFMCLVALIDARSSMLWRLSFGVASTAAIVLLVSLNRRSVGRWARVNEVGNWAAIALFAGVAIVAIWPHRLDEVMSAAPRTVESLLFCLLAFDGLAVAWTMLFAEAHETTERS